MAYYGIINAETLREVEAREFTQLFKEQLAEIDEEIKVLVADDPTIYEAEFEYDEVYDETIGALQAAGYTTHVRGVDDDDTVILTVSWMEEDEDDDTCGCPPPSCCNPRPCC